METIIVKERGQITLPKKMREKLGIKPKTILTAAVRDGSLVITPAKAISVRSFSDEFVRDIIKRDTLKKGERKEIISKWKKK
jgi:AbrB family looped-hinge helix DNA binding protein